MQAKAEGGLRDMGELRKRRREYEDLFEHPAEFLDGDELEEEDWAAIAVQAGYDGTFDVMDD